MVANPSNPTTYSIYSEDIIKNFSFNCIRLGSFSTSKLNNKDTPFRRHTKTILLFQWLQQSLPILIWLRKKPVFVSVAVNRICTSSYEYAFLTLPWFHRSALWLFCVMSSKRWRSLSVSIVTKEVPCSNGCTKRSCLFFSYKSPPSFFIVSWDDATSLIFRESKSIEIPFPAETQIVPGNIGNTLTSYYSKDKCCGSGIYN